MAQIPHGCGCGCGTSIWCLAWEPPYVMGVVLKRKKEKKEKEKEKKKNRVNHIITIISAGGIQFST